MVASAGSLDPTAQLAPRPTVPATGRGCLDPGAVLLAGALVVISQPPHLSRAAIAVRVACAREARRLSVGSVTNGKRGRLRRVRHSDRSSARRGTPFPPGRHASVSFPL